MPATAGDLETDPEIAAHELAIETLRAGIAVRRERIAAEKATAKAGRRSATNDEAGGKTLRQ